MKTQYKSVIELAQAVEDARAQKRDMIADSRQLVVQDDGKTLAVNGQGAWPMDDYTHRQLDTRLGIPAKYADKMRAEAVRG